MIGNLIAGSLSLGVVPSTSSYESIASASGTGSSATITFSSIPSTYQHLQIRGIARNTNASNRADLGIRLNGDTGSNYAQHNLYGNGSSASAGSNTGGTSAFVGWTTAANATADIMGAAIIDILDYNSTTKNKTIRAFVGEDLNSATTDATVWLASGLWLNTNAITSLSLYAAFGNFNTQTTFALYGIKGA